MMLFTASQLNANGLCKHQTALTVSRVLHAKASRYKWRWWKVDRQKLQPPQPSLSIIMPTPKLRMVPRCIAAHRMCVCVCVSHVNMANEARNAIISNMWLLFATRRRNIENASLPIHREPSSPLHSPTQCTLHTAHVLAARLQLQQGHT